MDYDSNFRKAKREIDRGIARGLHSVGAFVETEAKVRSAVRTGNLRSSISFNTEPRENAVVIGTNVHYAPHLEYGTEKMAPQPFLKPAVKENQDKIETIFERAYKRGLL